MLTVFYIGTLIREEAQGSGERGDLHTYPHGKESLKVKNRSLVQKQSPSRFSYVSLTVERCWTGSGAGTCKGSRGCGGAVLLYVVHVNPICGCITLGVEHVCGHGQVPKDRQEDGDTQAY